MSRPLVAHPNWEEELMVHYDYEYDSPAAGFQPLPHVLPTGAGRGEDTRVESRPMESAHGFIPPDLIGSAIGDTTWGMSPMVYGSSRATSAGAPNQHIPPNPHYTPSGHAAQSSSIDCYTPLISASGVGNHETSPQTCHTVGEADKPGRPSQRRAIKGKPHLHKASSRPSENHPMQCKWEGCTYLGTFKQESSLIRHLRNFHFTPLAHHCPVEGCDKVCNRGDNLMQHMRNNHHFH